MLRRNFNEDDFQDEYEHDFNFEGQDDEEGEGEFIHYVGKTDLLNSIQDMEMFEMNFNAKILKLSLKLAESNWFWKYRTINKKTKIINRIYHSLNKMLMPIEEFNLNEDLGEE